MSELRNNIKYAIEGQLDSGGFLNEIVTALEDLQGSTEDIKQIMSEHEQLQNSKKKMGIEDLRFYSGIDQVSMGEVVVLTKEEAKIIDKHPKSFNEITDWHRLESFDSQLQSDRFFLVCTGNLYYTFKEMKHDWLAYKLARIE